MRTLTILSVFLIGCGGSGSTTGDTSDDTAADSADTGYDMIPPDIPPDTTTDMAEDTAEDPADDAADTVEDSDGSLTECEVHGGTCTPPVAGCTVCSEGSLPYHSARGCSGMDWCCMPGTPGDTACETAGGICIPVIPESSCPHGWGSSTVECSGEGSGCCLPSDSCA
jgi:hypothetical protein